MNTLKIGGTLVSVWTGFNLLLAVAILIAITAFGRNAPGLSILLTDEEIQQLHPNVLATMNGIAVLANACIAALCMLALVVTRTALQVRARWALWSLAGALGGVQTFGYVSDAYFGHRNLVANLVSTAVLGVGLVLAAWPGAGKSHPPVAT